MVKRFLQLAVIGLVLVILFGADPTRPLAASDTPSLYLHRGMVALDEGVSTTLAVPTLFSPIATYQIIQFNAPITPADRAALQQSGVKILEYIPDYAYLVEGAEAQLEAATRQPSVYRSVPFTAADKLSPGLLMALDGASETLTNVQLFDWNGALLASHDALTAEQLLTLAANPTVRWAEQHQPAVLFNDEARQIGHVESVWQDLGLYGAGQIVGIADSGLDTGNFATISPDFAPSRIAAGIALVDGESWNDNFGHGTHVAGSLLGAGVQSGANPATKAYEGSYAGMAPEASVVVQAFEVGSDGSLSGLDEDFSTLFAQAYDEGARIHSNSWGGATGESGDAQYGGYPFGAQRTDAFVWDNPDMAIFVAAGNSGTDGAPAAFCLDGDGVVDPDSMASPGVAKNVITVGASENLRPSGGAADLNWFLIGCFFFPPIAFDTVSNDPTGMAAFSSRGPTDDGRIKPDLVAPGTNVISNRSHVPGANPLWAAHESNEHYVYSGGTSMATPIAAGMGTLLRQWLNDQGIANPTAALLKALLLNGAANIAPGQYDEGATQEIPTAWPNSVAGWGRADLGFLTDGAERPFWFIENNAGLETGETQVYTDTVSTPLTVVSSDQSLRIHLVWTDPPASLSAAKQLVNDLDLRVIAPDGTLLYGNGVDGGDRINNVEGLVIDTPQTGTYTITVRAHNVPLGPQPYAIAVSGPLATDDTPNPPGGETYFIYMPLVAK